MADRKKWQDILIIVFLGLYPLRHIGIGLDLWDTGYNYANFLYMGTEHMDDMWLFATYLSNAVGHLFTKLPGGGTLIGMNFYTGLCVSVLAVAGYLFCTRTLKMEKLPVFIGEFAAVSLCWCPTALLYNYLTYVLLAACVMLLYPGLTKDSARHLFGAGVCLGANVLVRFSNLPEAALIVAVWGYAFLETEEKKDRRLISRIVRYTLWCLGGYLTALAVLLGYIHFRYGIDAYVSGVVRLFAMTDTATDYQSASMIKKMLNEYVTNLYWVARIGVIVLAGIAGFAAAGVLEQRLLRRTREQENTKDGRLRLFAGGALRGAWCAVTALMVCWLYYRGFCSTEFYTYGPVLRPGVSFLTLTLGIAVIRILQRNVGKEEKLFGGLMILVVLLTSIGSNNGVMPSWNNLFLAAPYTFRMSAKFIRSAGDYFVGKGKRIRIIFFPAKTVLTALLAVFLFQSAGFGWCFVFAEATGVQNAVATVDNNQALKGVKMPPEKAQWMTQISAYVQERELEGQEVILFGWIPSLSYYLKMPSAFNPWSDLASYGTDVMAQELAQLDKGGETPVIMVENDYMQYMTMGREALSESGVLSEKRLETIGKEESKIDLLKEFIERNDYQVTFSNDKFTVLEKN